MGGSVPGAAARLKAVLGHDGLLPLTPDEVARWAWFVRVVGAEPETSLIAPELAEDIMALYGRVAAGEVAARLGPMAVRATSRTRVVSAPTGVRHRAGAGDEPAAQAPGLFVLTCPQGRFPKSQSISVRRQCSDCRRCMRPQR